MNLWCWVIVLFVVAAGSTSPRAATIPVGGPDGCSLANAINSANADTSIGNCSPGSGTDLIITPDDWSVTLDSRLPTIDTSMTIRTETANGLLTISGDNEHQIMRIRGLDTTLILQGVVLIDSQTDDSSVASIGAMNIRDASVSLIDSRLTGHVNSASSLLAASAIDIEGGELSLTRVMVQGSDDNALVIAETAEISISESTIENVNSDSCCGSRFIVGNSELAIEKTLFDSSSLFVDDNSAATIVNSTFARSAFSTPGTSIFTRDSVLEVSHTTLIGDLLNTNAILSLSNSSIGRCALFSGTAVVLNRGNFNYRENCFGPDDGNQGVLPLADNGGLTRTRGLTLDSDMINAADQTLCEPVDQRGVERTGPCDIGAFEVAPTADLSAELSVDPVGPYVGDQLIEATLEIRNLGPGPATDVKIQIDLTLASIEIIDSSVCPALPCQVATIEVNQAVNIPVQLRIANSISSTFEIDATALSTTSSLHQDPNENDPGTNNRARFESPITASADVAVALDLLTSPPFVVGQLISYEAVIENDGPQSATGLSLAIAQDNIVILSFTGCTSSTGPNCNLANIASGGSRTVTFTAQVTGALFDAVATVAADQVDVNPTNNVDFLNNGGAVADTNIGVLMNLQTPPPYYSGQFLEYVIAIRAEDPATNLQLSYNFPGAELIGIEGCGGTAPCELPFALSSGQTVTLFARFFAPIGPTESEFEVTVIPGQVDTDLSNNTARIESNFNGAADIFTQLELMTESPFVAGQEIVYALRVGNGGINDVTNLAIELIPQNLSLELVSGQQCQEMDCLIGQLDRFNEENVTLVYSIDAEGAFDLTASAFADEFDPTESNNVDASDNGGTAEPGVVFDVIFNDRFAPREF